ncbi:GNAT family N-acetyltransferase [Streptomyces sp. bgisy100]|uniref:GNAT family N-acetyltransferase n=1 Tax=Streptomyces sp. bgisy100 TaxID=3413783 RepID=UPI003D75A328
MNSTPRTRVSWWPVTLRTPRLTLRPVIAEDLPPIERLWRDEDVRRYLGGPVDESKIVTRRARLAGTPGVFTIAGRGAEEVLGLVTIDPWSAREGTEVSYLLLPEHWGRGVGREAVGAAVDWALRSVPGTAQVVAVTQAANRMSRRLLEGIGMQLVDRIVEYGEQQTVYRRPAVPTPAAGGGPA